MKKKILQLLKTTYKKNGLSDKALDGLASSLEKTIADDATDDDITTAIAGVEPLVKIMQSEADALRTKYKADAEKYQALKTKLEGKEGDPKEEEDPEPAEQGEKVPAWAKKLIQRNEALEQRLANIDKGTVTTTRKQALEEKLKGINPKLSAKILKDFDRLQFKDDAEFDTYVEETVADLGEFEDSDPKQPAMGAVGAPIIGTGKTTAKTIDADIAAWAEKEKPKPEAPAEK